MRTESDLMKRAMDVVLSAGLLLATAPLWALVAVAIRLTSTGPVLYRGDRIGRDGHPFTMFKFRSMRADAERSGPEITGAADARVTPVGRLLRLTKLDELPQLWNVLRADMSLVGPRPEAPAYVALYDDRQRAVLRVRPGITGPAQLFFRHEQDLLTADDVERQYRTEILPAKLDIDLRYLRERSLLMDARLLWLTAFRLFRKTDAAAPNLRTGAEAPALALGSPSVSETPR